MSASDIYFSLNNPKIIESHVRVCVIGLKIFHDHVRIQDSEKLLFYDSVYLNTLVSS